LDDTLDLSDDDRLNAAPSTLPAVTSPSSADIRVGLSTSGRLFEFDAGDDSVESAVGVADGKSMSVLVGVVGPEPVTSVE